MSWKMLIVFCVQSSKYSLKKDDLMSSQLSVSRRRARGFTLIELLVVIAIIGVLVALLLPAVQQAREAARRSQCKNNLKQIGLAFHNYHETFNTWTIFRWTQFTGNSPSGSRGILNNAQGWALPLLPYLDQKPLFDQYNLNLSPLNAVNAGVVSAPVKVFLCPTTPRTSNTVPLNISGTEFDTAFGTSGMPAMAVNAGATDYITFDKSSDQLNGTAGVSAGYFQVNNRNEGPLGEFSTDVFVLDPPQISDRIMSTQKRDVKDGLSNTFLIEEVAGRNTLYARSGKTIAPLSNVLTDAAYVQQQFGAGWWADPRNQLRPKAGSFDGLLNATNTAHFPGNCFINCTNDRAYGTGGYSFHPGGVMVLLADGSARMISENMSGVTFRSLVSRDEGDPIGDF